MPRQFLDTRSPRVIGTCADCVYWDAFLAGADGLRKRGVCRRAPPSESSPSYPFGTAPLPWPCTEFRDWCGEWRQGVELPSKPAVFVAVPSPDPSAPEA